MSRVEKHHVLFPNKLWTQYDSGKILRTSPGLIVPLYHGGHEQIHKRLEQVPLLDSYTLDKVARDFEPIIDKPILSIYALQRAITEATQFNSRSSKIARSLGQVVCDALDMQIPIIREGIVRL